LQESKFILNFNLENVESYLDLYTLKEIKNNLKRQI